MRARRWVFCLLSVFALASCGNRETQTPESSAPPALENETREPAESPLPDLDFSGLETEMPPEDYAAVESFRPVLTGEASFSWTAGPYRGYEEDWASRDVTLGEFHAALWADNGTETDALELDSLAVADVIRSGSRDLVLLFRDLGYNYLVLHQAEDGVVYGTDFSVRWFMDLQQNGMYIGSSGADYQTYYHMSFEDGRFASQELAQAAGGTYAVNGLQVTEEEFAVWEFETMVGGVSWYGPDGALLEDSPG